MAPVGKGVGTSWKDYGGRQHRHALMLDLVVTMQACPEGPPATRPEAGWDTRGWAVGLGEEIETTQRR